jgi:hypothetical protein
VTLKKEPIVADLRVEVLALVKMLVLFLDVTPCSWVENACPENGDSALFRNVSYISAHSTQRHFR